MKITSLGPDFAAELRGVTLAEIAADDAAYAAARAAFEEHSVLVFRGQHVTDEIQLAFSRRFGPPEVTKVGSLGTGTHFVTLSTIDADGKVVPPDHRLALRNRANQLWHTDSSFKAVPALASVLSARIIAVRGGETEFVSTRRAFERLDPVQRSKVEHGYAWHDYAHSRGQIAPDLASPEERAALPPQCWRLTWKNPANGRSAIYLASHAYAIEGMEQAAGDQADRGVDGGGDSTGDKLSAQLAQRRCRHVGQPRHHASRPALARTRGAPDGAHHDLGDRGGRPRLGAPAASAGGGITATACVKSCRSKPMRIWPGRAD